MARLGLTRYDKDAPLKEDLVQVGKVKVILKPAYRTPSQAIIKTGDQVTRTDDCSQPAQELKRSVFMHLSVVKSTESNRPLHPLLQ